MNADVLLKQCLAYFKEYEGDNNEAVIKNGEKTLILRKPFGIEGANYIFYNIIREHGREEGTINDLEDFIEITDEFANLYKQEISLEEIGKEENADFGYEYSNYGFPLERKK